MNMNRRNLLNAGNMVIGKVITADRVGYTGSEQELTRILRTFNYKDVLVTLSRINLLFHRSANLSRDERILKENFCSPTMLNAIDAFAALEGDFVFNRQATLRLLEKCACVSDSHSTRNFGRIDVRNDLAKAYLNVNGLLDKGSSAPSMTADEERKQYLVECIPFYEYAVNSSPEYEIKKLMVRTEEFLNHLQKQPSELNVNEIFYQKTGLTLQDYQRLIFGICAFYWNLTPEGIRRQDPLMDKSLFFDPNGRSQDLTPLYEKLLPHICIPMDKLKDGAEKHPQFDEEFRLWRKFPLLEISENRTICVDFSFLLDKLQTGIFWTIRGCLKDRNNKAGSFERLWGDVFEDYAASIIQRGINTQNPSSRERFIINPKYDQKRQVECADIAICCDDTLILMECKATLLSSEAKFSGDFDKFYDNIKPAKKGIKQLWNAIQRLGNLYQSERRIVKGIDISQVKKIYPVLVLSDRIFSGIFMNEFFDSEFRSLVQQSYLMEDLKVMPLTVLTIMDLESLEPYMCDKPLHVHLDKWLDWFEENHRNFGFSAYLPSLVNNNLREHLFMNHEFDRITADAQEYFSSRGIS